jgi:hypothetical protein
VCMPLPSSAMDQRDRVLRGRERAELSHAPRSPPTRIGKSSQGGIHQSGSFRRVARGLRIIDEEVGSLWMSNRRSTGKFGAYELQRITTWTQQKTALLRRLYLGGDQTPRRHNIPLPTRYSILPLQINLRDGSTSTSSAMGHRPQFTPSCKAKIERDSRPSWIYSYRQQGTN